MTYTLLLEGLLSPRALVPLLLFVVIAVYAPHLSNEFIFDDHPQIEHNPAVRGELPLGNALGQGVWAHTRNQTGSVDRFYRPLFTLAHRLVYQASHGAPWAFHLLNLGLHLTGTLLVVAALRRLGFHATEALAAAAIFALHPLAGEVVYWASCVSDLLVQVGLLLALICALANDQGSLLRRSVCLAGAAAGLLIGLLAKETAVVIAPILTLEVMRHPRHEWKKRLIATAPLWCVTFGYLLLRAQYVSSGLGELLPEGLKNISNFGLALGWFAKRLLIPYPLTPFPVFPLNPTAISLLLGIMLLLFLFVTITLTLCLRPQRLFWIGWLLLPLGITLVPLLFTYKQAVGAPVAERYLYLSLVPWSAMLVRLFSRPLACFFQARTYRIAAPALCIVACLTSGSMVYSYGNVFHDDTTYFQRASTYNPESPAVLSWLATLEIRKNRYQSALILLERVKEREPGMPGLYMNLGTVLSGLQRLPEAVQAFYLALLHNPAQPGAHHGIADALYGLGHIDDAIYHYREELKADPGSVPVKCDLGICLFQKRDVAGALTFWEDALQTEDAALIRFNLGNAYRNMGQKHLAKRHFQRFLEISDGSFAEQRQLAARWLLEPP